MEKVTVELDRKVIDDIRELRMLSLNDFYEMLPIEHFLRIKSNLTEEKVIEHAITSILNIARRHQEYHS